MNLFQDCDFCIFSYIICHLKISLSIKMLTLLGFGNILRQCWNWLSGNPPPPHQHNDWLYDSLAILICIFFLPLLLPPSTLFFRYPIPPFSIWGSYNITHLSDGFRIGFGKCSLSLLGVIGLNPKWGDGNHVSSGHSPFSRLREELRQKTCYNSKEYCIFYF